MSQAHTSFVVMAVARIAVGGPCYPHLNLPPSSAICVWTCRYALRGEHSVRLLTHAVQTIGIQAPLSSSVAPPILSSLPSLCHRSGFRSSLPPDQSGWKGVHSTSHGPHGHPSGEDHRVCDLCVCVEGLPRLCGQERTERWALM